MKILKSRSAAVVAGATVLVTLGGVGGAVAGGDAQGRPAGPPSVTGYEVKSETFAALPPGGDTFGVECSEGKRPLGGGYDTTGAVEVTGDKPWWGTFGSPNESTDPNRPIGWNVRGTLNGGTVTVWAICATVTS